MEATTVLATHANNAAVEEGRAIPLVRVRLDSVDVLRGVIMILMTLDHTRDFLGVTGVNPTDPTQTAIPFFFTRWITHFCAPVFFLLTGTGAYLSLRRCFGFQFNFDYHVTFLNVLWALGWAMVVPSGLVHLPIWLTTTLGLVMIAGHNLLDSVQSSRAIWSILHVPNFIFQSPQHSVFVGYPLIPWIGVTAIGYGLGRVYAWSSERRGSFLLGTGLGATAGFVILRSLNTYGDPVRWTTQKSATFTVLSFLNTNKYPPSLAFLLMTLGPVLVFLWALDRRTPDALRHALILGRVPMFYYLLHMPVIHLLAVAVCYARYSHVHWMFESPTISQFPITAPPGWGFSLPVVYLIWASVVVALYPLCRWFAGLKRRRGDAWLSYL